MAMPMNKKLKVGSKINFSNPRTMNIEEYIVERMEGNMVIASGKRGGKVRTVKLHKSLISDTLEITPFSRNQCKSSRKHKFRVGQTVNYQKKKKNKKWTIVAISGSLVTLELTEWYHTDTLLVDISLLEYVNKPKIEELSTYIWIKTKNINGKVGNWAKQKIEAVRDFIAGKVDKYARTLTILGTLAGIAFIVAVSWAYFTVMGMFQ